MPEEPPNIDARFAALVATSTGRSSRISVARIDRVEIRSAVVAPVRFGLVLRVTRLEGRSSQILEPIRRVAARYLGVRCAPWGFSKAFDGVRGLTQLRGRE